MSAVAIVILAWISYPSRLATRVNDFDVKRLSVCPMHCCDIRSIKFVRLNNRIRPPIGIKNTRLEHRYRKWVRKSFVFMKNCLKIGSVVFYSMNRIQPALK